MYTPIEESELIITPKGTIYHLDLAPYQLAKTIITVGDPGRVSEVSKHFDNIEHKAHHREFVSHTGHLGKKRITVIGTGIGPDNIDIVLNEVDALANIDFTTRHQKEDTTSLTIIRLGTCGSLQEDIPVGSFVVSTHGLGLDNLMHYYQFQNTEEEKGIIDDFKKHTGLSNVITPYIAEGSKYLASFFNENYLHGITATCPGFYAPQGRVLRGAIAFPHLVESLSTFKSGIHRILNFEMETSAIYGLGGILGHQCLSINTAVAYRLHKKFSADPKAAIHKMIMQSLEIIEKIPERNTDKI